jgi:hypothetical protein
MEQAEEQKRHPVPFRRTPARVEADSSANLFPSPSIVSRYNGKCETLSMDEAVALI